MVIDFDKDNIALHYKRLFGESIADNDYESAIDYLLKYNEETHFPDFHLACGMIYLQMTRDSDDAELVYLAYREFMLHLIRQPNCVRAYRNLVITDYMRTSLTPEYGTWFAKRGVDFGAILKEIIANTLESEGDPFNFDLIFKQGEYGEIDPDYSEDKKLLLDMLDWDEYPYDKLEKLSPEQKKALADSCDDKTKNALNGFADAVDNKVIDFNAAIGGKQKKSVKHNSTVPFEKQEGELGEILKDLVDREFESDIPDIDFYDDYDDDDYDDAVDVDASVTDSDGDPFAESDEPRDGDIPVTQKLGLAERLCSSGEYGPALEMLTGIPKSDRNYFFAVAMRAFVYLESGDLKKAEAALAEAKSLRPSHALVGTMLCRLYEAQGRENLIPAVLDGIDITSYLSGDHVYKALEYIIKYYDEDRAIDVMEDYIEEYNLMSMRLIYAQMLYNRGEKEYAVEELYRLSRIFYDDINIIFFYISAKLGAEKLPVGEEAPQGLLSVMVEEYMGLINSGNLTKVDFYDDTVSVLTEFFISLEFRNDKKMLIKMFDTVKTLASNPDFEEKARDALVSPYVEPIVKAVILSEFYKRDTGTEFLAEVMYRPIPSDCIAKLGEGFSVPYYVAYAYVAMMCNDYLDVFVSEAEKCKNALGGEKVDDSALEYYLIKNAFDACDTEQEERYVFPLGFKSKAAAARAYAEIKKIIDRKI